jgi:hypothetical protein
MAAQILPTESISTDFAKILDLLAISEIAIHSKNLSNLTVTHH